MARVQYEEERHARELHQAFAELFGPTRPPVELSIKGGGVHWDCAVSRGSRCCSVHCFDTKGPEYLASFRDSETERASGRTFSRGKISGAAADWLNGCELPELYDRYAFVDKTKRSMDAIQREALSLRPRLVGATSSELRRSFGEYKLRFEAGDRGCEIGYYGYEKFPDAEFSWDQCPLVRTKVEDVARFSDVLEAWLVDGAMPSVVRARFPEAEVRELAQYYEEGRPVEGEFIESWRNIERFFREMPSGVVPPTVLPFIVQICTAGYEGTLRAGQSMTTFVVSRSRRHGLRDGQPAIYFEFGRRGMVVSVRLDRKKERHTFEQVELTAEVRALLDRLVEQAID
jgi:hypothetical protein